MTEEPICQRCLKCCYLVDVKTNKPTKKLCKYAIKLKIGGVCRIYRNRLGKDIGIGNKCIMRVNSKLEYDGCPFNKVKI